MEQKPTIGRVVHYHLIDDGTIVPAIIVDVHSNVAVDLFVMNPHQTVGGAIPNTGYFERFVTTGETNGCWSWPPRT